MKPSVFSAANSKIITACVVLVLDRNPVHPLSASAPLCSGGVLEENLNNFHISQTLPLPPNQGSLQHHELTIQIQIQKQQQIELLFNKMIYVLLLSGNFAGPIGLP